MTALLCAESGAGIQVFRYFLGESTLQLTYGTLQLTYGQISVTAFAFRDFLTVHNDMAGRLDTYPHLRAIDGHHGDLHIVANSQSLAGTACKNEHVSNVPSLSGRIYSRDQPTAYEGLVDVRVG
jgi:hypothetical protein